MRTLFNLLQRKDQQGFILALGYYVQLDHENAGMFPAIETESQAMIMTIDINLLRRVCQKLPPRQFKLGIQLLYVNPKSGMAYSIFGPDKRSLVKSVPFQSLTMKRFRILSRKKNPFSWCWQAPSSSREGIDQKLFNEAIRKLSASRFPTE